MWELEKGLHCRIFKALEAEFRRHAREEDGLLMPDMLSFGLSREATGRGEHLRREGGSRLHRSFAELGFRCQEFV